MRKPTTTSRAEGAIAALATGEISLTELPARLQAIAATLGIMLSDGYSKAEIARYYGKSRRWVSDRLLELEREIQNRIDWLRAQEPGRPPE